MNGTTRNWRRAFLCALFAFILPAPAVAQDLGQGWNDADRQWFYFTTQGSRLIRRDWFLALERHDSQDLFLADGLERFGYLPGAKSSLNPYQLPVGFVVDTPASKQWVGMTCAACHTSDITFKGTTMRVDGAPAGADFYEFLAKLGLALRNAANDDATFLRFAARVLGSQNNEANRIKLRVDLRAESTKFTKFLKQSTPTEARWGPARADAFGMIFNRVTSIDLSIDDNSKSPNAPVSYPFLWGTSHHDFTQWNGAIPNKLEIERLARNVGQVLGVFGTIDLTRQVLFGYPSSVNKDNLKALEKRVAKLTAPVWPEALFGTPDPVRVARGRTLYADNCSDCHMLVPKESQLQPAMVRVVPVTSVQTDDAMTKMVATREGATGILEGRRTFPFGKKLGPREQSTDILNHAVAGAIVGPQTAALTKPATIGPLFHPSVAVGNYKARPLNGIWATAPYLHNGSVRTLKQLLMPPASRDAKFLVGSREFDPVEVGFANAGANWPGAQAFEFDTTIPGNSKDGHIFGTGMSQDERDALLEYMKTL